MRGAVVRGKDRIPRSFRPHCTQHNAPDDRGNERRHKNAHLGLGNLLIGLGCKFGDEQRHGEVRCPRGSRGPYTSLARVTASGFRATKSVANSRGDPNLSGVPWLQAGPAQFAT